MSKPEEFNDWPDTLHVDWHYRAVVKRIVDGDTLYCFVDLGLNQYAYESIRLSDVHAPELFSGMERDRGAEAKAHLESICGPGTKVIIETQKDRETFGRYVASLHEDDEVESINAQMNRWLTEKGYTGGA